MSAVIFLWPKPNVTRAMLSLPASIGEIEIELRELFPTGHPVLFSSGRAAIAIVVAHLRLNRSDTVDIFPYASHCVLDAVARRAMPEVHARSAVLRIVYHQLGFVQEHGLAGPVIEDAVDTLCVPGTPLFPAGGAFELWSFPKLLGTLGGAVMWCRSPEDAASLRRCRTEAGGRFLQWILRAVGTSSATSHMWWQGAEPALGRPVALQLGEIRSAIRAWAAIVDRRRENLDTARRLLPTWLKLTDGRLPCAVPAETPDGMSVAQEFDLSAGMRFFERVSDGTRELVRLLPVPIHHEMQRARIAALVARLGKADPLP
jgi:putative PLP-dependent aminotransferase (TIGR04422 family)